MIDRCFVQKLESKLNFKLSQHWDIFCALQSRPLLRTPQLSMKEEYISLSLSPQKTTWYTFLNVIIYMLSFAILKGVFVLPDCVDGKPMSLEMKHVVSTYLLCCRFPLISLTFLKTFWREKLTLRKILIKMRYANIFVTFLKMKSSNMLVSIFVNCHFSTGSKGYTDSIMIDIELCFMINGGHLS